MKVPHFDQQLIDILISLCDETDTPFSKDVKQLALDGKVLEILKLRVNPSNYRTPHDYYADAVVAEFLRKFEDFDLGLDLKEEAKALFLENEAKNFVSNQRFKRLWFQSVPLDGYDMKLLDLLSAVKANVRALLGPIPKTLDLGRFGKGSTFADIGRYTTVPDKMSSRPTVTRSARDLLAPFFVETAWFLSLCDSSTFSEPLTVRGNRFLSVPKTALAERGICVEPGLNVFWQLSIGTFIKERLKKFGYNLYTAQERHRSMAQIGSLTGKWATIDLKNASDLFSYWFVRHVVPDDWFDVLSMLRSPTTEVDGRVIVQEKFSSMGNGFTFELMSVILTAICLTLGEGKYHLMGEPTVRGLSGPVRCDQYGDISVFGDDVIVPTPIAESLVKLLPILGLEINPKKTFLSGGFRESCGGDYFDGEDVRAFNLKKDPNEIHRNFALANAIRRLGRQHRTGVFGFGDYKRTWFMVINRVPSFARKLRGPEHLGDLVIHDDREYWHQRSSKRLSFRVTPDGRRFVRAWLPISRTLPMRLWHPATQLASALYGVPSRGPTPRQGGEDLVKGFRKGWVAVGW